MNGTAQVQCITPLPGGSALARGPETIWHPDWLGSPRLGSSPSNRTVTFDRAFAPFGEAYDTVTGGTTNLSFTGLLQDSVSGEYDTPARLLHPGQGRWISPDPAGLAAADPGNPQSWNRYAYVVNNPLALIDPTGLDYCSGNSPYTSGGGGTENLPAPWCSQICALGYLAACEGYYNAFEGLQAMVNSLGGIGGGFLPGENSINWPLGTGNLFGDIWNALGLPSGLSCPQVGGVSNFLCGGINPIMDSNPPGVDPNVVCDDNGNCTTFDEVQVTDKEPSSLLHLSKDDCEKLSGDIEQAGAIAGAAGVPFLPFKEAGIKVKVPKILTRWALPVAAAAVTFALSEAAFKAVGRCYW